MSWAAPGADVVIVGGAVVGSAAAYFLASRPDFHSRICVIEQDPSYQHCATTRSLASIRHQFSTPENILASMFGTAFFRQASELLRVADEAPDLAFKEGGYLFLASEAGMAVLQSNHQLQRSLGANVALLQPSELQARFPWLQTAGLSGGALGLAGEGWIDAHALMHGFKRKAQSLGVQYVHGKVASLHCDGGRVRSVRLDDGRTLGCDWVINAAGTGATALARSAGMALPVQSRKRCVFYVSTPQPLGPCPLVIVPGGAYFRPEGTGYVCGIAPSDAQDPECHDFDVDHRQFEEWVWPQLAEQVPAFEALRVEHAWAGHYDVNMLDHNAILGPHPDVANLLFANGFSGHGVQHSPAVGRAVAEWVCTGGYETLDFSRLGWARVLAGQPMWETNVV